MKKINQSQSKGPYTSGVVFGGRKTAGDAFHILQISALSFDQAKV